MPIPTPHKTEKKSDFIARCASDSTMNKEYPDNKQKIAICFQKWEDRKAKAAYVITAAGEEFATFLNDPDAS